MSHEEHIRIISDSVKIADGRIPIIAGAGSNSTEEAIFLTKSSEDVGANAVLHVTGYYNNPTQKQVIEHFKQIDRSTSLPIIVYNIPSRTGQELTVETIIELAKLDHVSGVKDSTSNVSRVSIERLEIKKDFSFLTGDDATSLGYLAHGGDGCISTSANIAPRLCSRMIAAVKANDLATAREIHNTLMPLHVALFIEPNPTGLKYAMSTLGLCKNELRLPLTPIDKSTRMKIDRALSLAGIGSPVGFA